MDPERQKRVEELFQELVARRPDERTAALEACDDELVRERVRSLLSADSRPTHEGLRSPWTPRESVLDALAREALPGVAARTPGPSDPNARQLEKYRIEGEIARGGVGVVLRGRDPDLGRDIAVKVLRDDVDDHAGTLQRFIEEAQIGGQLQHPGIVPIYDIGLERPGRPFFTMRLIEGDTLESLLRGRHDLAAERARWIGVFAQICQAVAYAHARGVLHRDLKPGNVMIGRFGEVQVVDWGLAKVLGRAEQPPANPPRDTSVRTVRSEGDSRSIVGSVMGTPSYMSPEQASGAVLSLDPRADVFSLGAILAEILTGAPAYDERDGDVLDLARAARLEPCRERLQHCDAPGELFAIASECLAVDPDARPADANVLAERIEGHLDAVEQRAEQARMDAVASRAREAGARRVQRLTVALASLILVTITAGGGVAWWIATERRDQVQRASEAVAGLLAEADRRQGVAEQDGSVASWRAALDAVERAEASDAVAAPAPDVRRRLDRSAQQIRSGLAAALVRRDQLARESALIARLEEIPIPPDVSHHVLDFDQHDATRRLVAYRALFGDQGLDPLTDELEELRAVLGGPDLALPVAAAFDDWSAALRLHGQDEASATLLRHAMALDPDPLRSQVRRLLVDHAAERGPALRELAASLDPRELPAATVVTVARVLRGLGDRDASVALLRAAHLRRPGEFSLAIHLAMTSEGLRPRVPDDVLRYYTTAVALRGDNALARFRLGIAAERAGQLDAAAEAYRAVEALRPDFVSAPVNLASVQFRLGDLDGAEASANRALAIDPGLAEAYINRSLVHRTRGDLTAALADTRQATDCDPELAKAWYERGLVQKLRGELRDAIADLSEAVRLEPGFASARAQIGHCHLDLGETDRAVEVGREALAFDDDDLQAWRLLERAHFQRGEVAACVEVQREIVARAPQLAETWRNMAVQLLNLDDPTAAVEAARRAATLENSTLAHFIHGWALRVAGRPEAAIEALQRARALDPTGASRLDIDGELARARAALAEGSGAD